MLFAEVVFLMDVFHVTSRNDQAGYFLDKLGFTGGKRVVGSTAILKTRAVLELAYLVPQVLLSSSF